MKKNLFLAISGLLAATLSFAQTSTEQFETESHGSASFTDNGVIFNIISHVELFDIQGNFPGTGWNGTANDNRYIDNSNSATAVNPSFSIKTTSNLFKVNRFWMYLSATNLNLNVAGTLTVTGLLSGVTKFAQTKTTGFATSLGTTNGYTLIDLTNLNGQNYSNIIIDELRLTAGGNYRYVALDAFTWVKDANVILPVTFGSVNASIKNNSLSVNWATEKETANDYFEIEASTNGQQFKKIATVASKATNGNSDVAIDYEWSSKAALPLAAVSLIALAFIPFMNMRRKKTWMLALTIWSVGAFSVTGCSKSGDSINNNQSYYIRVAQVDKDGTKTFSKVVKVQQDH